ncbi:MAG: hypothetical protein QOI14_165, partial [Actinomycetota bacterium]|nr:hypothetical protein [Actinomycetota bacterium]
RGSTDTETYLWDEMQQLASDRGARLYTSIGHRPRGAGNWLSASDVSRRVTLKSVFPDLASSDLYICGPQAWTDVVVADAKSKGVPSHQIHTERFDW